VKVALLTARDPLQVADGTAPAQVAVDLADEGHEVTLVLLEDAVTPAREGHRLAGALAHAVRAGVRVVAEEEALARRAVNRLGEGIKPTTFGEVVDLLMQRTDRQAWL